MRAELQWPKDTTADLRCCQSFISSTPGRDVLAVFFGNASYDMSLLLLVHKKVLVLSQAQTRQPLQAAARLGFAKESKELWKALDKDDSGADAQLMLC